ncbi:Retrovirus-related Pol polyprotein from transposon RE2, partial [Linum perenne]
FTLFNILFFFLYSNISTLVSIKLTETNYLLWKSKIQPFLIGQNLWPFVDGSFPCPPQFIPSYDGKTMNLNPSTTSWVQTDQTLVNLINATLTESVLAQVVGLQTNLS